MIDVFLHFEYHIFDYMFQDFEFALESNNYMSCKLNSIVLSVPHTMLYYAYMYLIKIVKKKTLKLFVERENKLYKDFVS